MSEKNSIELQAKLDVAQSKSNINSDIKKIQSQINHLKIPVEVDQTQGSKAGQKMGQSIVQGIKGVLQTITLFDNIKNVGRGKKYPLICNCFEYADNGMCSLGY